MRPPRVTGRVLSWVVTACTAAAVACVAGCRRDAPAGDESAAIVVGVASARLGDLADSMTATGTVVPATSADFTVFASEPAQIAEAPKEEGDTVAEGDLLVRFEVPSVTQEVAFRQTELADATARVDRTRRDLASATALLDRGLVPRQQVDNARNASLEAQAALTEATARLEAARLLQARATIRARFPGVVIRKWHQTGDFVAGTAADPVLRVIDPARTQITLTLSQAEVARVSNGQPATVRAPGRDGEPGMIVSRPMVIDPATPTTDVRVSFQTPSTLPIDTVVEVIIVIDQRQNVIVVPRAALQRDEESAYVMVAGDDDHAHRRPVQVGLMTSDLVHITTGLAPAERVIVTGFDQLTDGAPIAINR